MNTLGLSGVFDTTASAALYINNQLAATAGESDFPQPTDSAYRLPYQAADLCLQTAGISPGEIDIVSIPASDFTHRTFNHWHHLKRHWYAPQHPLHTLHKRNHHASREKAAIHRLLTHLGINPQHIIIDSTDSIQAYATAAYHLSGLTGDAAIALIGLENTPFSSVFGHYDGKHFHPIAHCSRPDCPEVMFHSMARYLGFDNHQDNYQHVFELGRQGNANRYDLSRLLHHYKGKLHVSTDYIRALPSTDFSENYSRYEVTSRLKHWLGPKRPTGDVQNPYNHYAASIHQLYLQTTINLIAKHLNDTLHTSGQLVLAGSGARNPFLINALRSQLPIHRISAPPFIDSRLLSIGTAMVNQIAHGIVLDPTQTPYVGRTYSRTECQQAHEATPGISAHKAPKQIVKRAAKYLLQGDSIGWFQGPNALGSHALDARCVLSLINTAQLPNTAIDHAIVGLEHTTHEIAQKFQQQHGSIIPIHTVSKTQHLTLYKLLVEIEAQTGTGALLQHALTTSGHPSLCTPQNALRAFLTSDMVCLCMDDFIITSNSLR